MVQTKEGGKTLRRTMIRKHGSEEAWKDYLRVIGGKGGSKRGDKGFALMDKDKVRAAGALGGKISRRGKKQHTVSELETKVEEETNGIR